MDRFDNHTPSIWQERSDVYWESKLTYTERDLESLDGRPSRFPSSVEAADHRADRQSAGVDTTVAPPSRRPAGAHELAGPTPQKDAA